MPFVFFDVRTSDMAASRKFYTELFGWRVDDVAMGQRTFPMLTDDGKPWGGFTQLAPDDTRAPQWLPYAPVSDVDKATVKAVALGGTVVRERTDLPVGSLTVVTDPGGAAIVLFQPADPAPA